MTHLIFLSILMSGCLVVESTGDISTPNTSNVGRKMSCQKIFSCGENNNQTVHIEHKEDACLNENNLEDYTQEWGDFCNDAIQEANSTGECSGTEHYCRVICEPYKPFEVCISN